MARLDEQPPRAGKVDALASFAFLQPLPSYAVIIAPLLAGALYFLAAKLGERLAFPSAPVSAFWAPNAIILATLLLAPRRTWWVYLLVLLPFHFLAQVGSYPLSQVFIQYFANTAEAVLAALAIDAMCPAPRRYDRVRTVLALIAFGGLLAPFATSLLMALAFKLVGIPQDFWLTAIVRTITNTFAIVALVPLIAHSMARLLGGRREVSFARAGEAVALTLSLATVCMVIFVLPFEERRLSLALLYAPLPLLAWAAMRFGTPGACGAALLVGATSTWGVLNGHGPFAGASPVQDALSLVAFHVAVSVALLILAALLEEWKRTGRELSASESRFRSIFEHNMIPTVLWRDGARITEANRAFLQLTGFSAADIDSGSLRIEDLFVFRSGESVSDLVRRNSLQHSVPAEGELTLRDGRHVPAIFSECAYSGETGGVVYALDLSAFRAADARRLKVENLHSAVLASLQDQIAIVDSAGVVLEINDSWRHGVQTGSAARFDRVLAGASFLAACEMAAGHGDPCAVEYLSALRAVLEGREVRRQWEFSEVSGTSHSWFEVSIERLRRPEGGAVITRTDVTARKEAEAEARNQRQQLTHLGRAAVLGQLSGAFAHELKQPLTSILGNAEAALRLLSSETLDLTEVREILNDIVSDDERAANVIQHLRALLDKGDMQRRPIDLNSTVREVLELARSELITRNVLVTTNLDPQIPLVIADRIQIQQVVLNLLINACEAMANRPVPERQVTLASWFVPRNASVEISVRDNGTGIASGDIERIFQPFVTTKSHGMGLGLAICRSVAESHHGRLWAENNKDHGAAFHLRIPIEGALQ